MPFNLDRLAGSAALRGALWITLIALVTTGLALSLQYLQMTQLLRSQIQANVEDETAALVRRYQAGGLAAVAAAIERQQDLPRINEFFYLLAAPDGSRIAGNLAFWPAGVDETGYHTFTTEVVGSAGTVRRRSVSARAVLLEDDFRLLVGSLSEEPMILQDQYLAALVWSLLGTGMLGLLLGFLYSRRGLDFVDAASDAGERFLSGNYDERLERSGRGDEYDRLAETINRFFEEVERLFGSLRAATDGLAHDLKTPLTRMRARLDLAEIEGASGAKLSDLVEENRQDLDALLSLVDEILSLARAEAIVSASFRPIELDAVVSEAVELYQPLAEERGVRIKTELQKARVDGARSLLAQMTTNLLDNAIKYTPAGGVIDVSLAPDAEGVRLTIRDTGPGIPADQREIALTRFARLDTSRTQPGSGIGLSVVATAARVHRARLRLFDNEPGLGVEITFPRPG